MSNGATTPGWPTNGAIEPPLVSVIVPTHHRPDLLRRTVRSILAQTLTDLELIIVFDGADEAAERNVAELGDQRVRTLVNAVPQGVGSARNRGLATALGRWVAFCDDDDLWAPDKLERQVRALDEHPTARWCAIGEIRLWEGGRLGPFVACPPSDRIPELLRSSNAIPGGGSGVVIDRELIMSLNGFDEELSMFADWDLWLRVSRVADVTVVNAPLLAYRDHVGAMSRDMVGVERELDRLHRRHDDASDRVPFSTLEVREWCYDRTIMFEDRRTRLRALRTLVAEERPSRSWTLGAVLRLAAPGSLVRYARRLEHRRWESSEVQRWVSSLDDDTSDQAAVPSRSDEPCLR